MSRKYYATAATLSSFLRFHHHFLLRSNAQLPAVASFIFILLVILSSSSLISATLSTRKITTPPRNSNNMKQHQYTNLVASSNVVKHRQGGLMDSSPSPSLYLNSETPKASTVHLEQQQNDPAIAQGAPQTTSVGSPYVVIASGSILLSIAVAIMIVDYCKHLRRVGIFERHANKETAAMYRRQALSALNEIPTNVDMLGALLLQEIHYKSTSSSVHGDPAFDKQRLIDAANNELTLPSPDRYYKYTTGGAVNQAIVIDEHQPPISEQKLVVQTIENGKNIPKSFSINSGSKDSNPDSHQPHYLRKPFLRQSSAQSSLLSVPMAKKKMENSYSNSQMALHLKNYGTFDSQLELQFFSENIPAIETVTRYLPMKGQTLSQTLMKHESIDENSVMMQSNSEKINSSKNNSSKNSSNSTLNAKCDDTPTTPKGDQGAFEGAFEGDHNQEMDSSGSSSYILLPAVTRRTTLIPAIGTGSDTILLTNSDDPLLAPQGDEMTPMGATLGVPSMGTSGSSGEGVNMTSSSTSSHVYLTPPKFLALACKKSTSDATCLVNSMVTNSTVFQAAVSPSVSSIGEGVGSVMVDATSISSFMSSSEGDAGTMKTKSHSSRLSSCSSSHRNALSRRTHQMIRRARYNVHSPMYERMTARLAQLYQATSPRPEVRAFSFSDVFESKQRLMLLEVQRRRKRAEMIRKLKRRHLLNGNLSTPAANGCGLLSSVVVGPAGRGGVRTRMLINTLRVPIRHEWKLY